MRPGQAPAQGQDSVWSDHEHVVETRTQFGSRIGAGAGIDVEPKAASCDVDFAVGRCVETLRLHRAVRRYAADHCCKAIAAFNPAAKALRIEVGGELVTEGGDTVGRHPVVGEGKRPGDVPGT